MYVTAITILIFFFLSLKYMYFLVIDVVSFRVRIYVYRFIRRALARLRLSIGVAEHRQFAHYVIFRTSDTPIIIIL